MSFFGFGAPTRNWKIGKFGEYQNTFNKYFEHPDEPKSRFFNRYSIYRFVVSRGSLEDDTRFYKILFHSWPKEPVFESIRFVLRIEDRGDPNNPLMKSTTFMSMEKPNSLCRFHKHYDILDYSSMCEKWIIDTVFHKNYEIHTLILESAPECFASVQGKFHVKRLEINADEYENDTCYMYYWLNLFRYRPGCVGPLSVKMKSPFIEMKIAAVPMLVEISRIELNGKFDITPFWVLTYNGFCFMWKNMEENKNFSSTELKLIFEKVRLTGPWIGIYLEQGNDKKNECMLKLLERQYGSNLSHDIGYKCTGVFSDIVTFYSEENRTVIEKSTDSSNLGVMNVEDWFIDLSVLEEYGLTRKGFQCSPKEKTESMWNVEGSHG
ncbi:unnamed protein product [Caenorhabditis angaria]|uniref:Uncharacterized protein n=1 Tax=Caenorhabditis angaria TaxID=860376 RepID=A0A9P1IUI4_9PELO|nr:unnamed protein product [Caenorhabditis angaria]